MTPPGRLRRTLAAVALAAAAVACGGPRTVSLEALTWDTDRYAGSEVTTSGVVVEFTTDDGATQRHYVIQDADANRVQLVPGEAAEPHVGQTVEVTGSFDFDPDRGRLLEVETIAPAGQAD